MNKANAKRALQAAIDCIDCNDTENALGYAAVGCASLADIPLTPGDPVAGYADKRLIDEVMRGVIDSESPPLFDEDEDGSGAYRYDDDGPGDLRQQLESARRLK